MTAFSYQWTNRAFLLTIKAKTSQRELAKRTRNFFSAFKIRTSDVGGFVLERTFGNCVCCAKSRIKSLARKQELLFLISCAKLRILVAGTCRRPSSVYSVQLFFDSLL